VFDQGSTHAVSLGRHNARFAAGAADDPDFNLDPPRDKKLLRRQLQAERMACTTATSARCICRRCCASGWSAATKPRSVPIADQGEFDALPALYRWTEGEDVKGRHRRIGCR